MSSIHWPRIFFLEVVTLVCKFRIIYFFCKVCSYAYFVLTKSAAGAEILAGIVFCTNHTRTFLAPAAGPRVDLGI